LLLSASCRHAIAHDLCRHRSRKGGHFPMQAGSRRRNAARRWALIAEMGGALGERDGNPDSNAVAHQADTDLGMSSPNMPVLDARPRRRAPDHRPKPGVALSGSCRSLAE
jgi:hypothetical protein